MAVVALVMAGGKGTRMAVEQEKPLLNLGCKPMIGHVLNALKRSKTVQEIIVAVSKYTPRTAKFSADFPVKVIETPGEGYVSDMQHAIRKLKLGTVLVVSADLPLLTGEIIDKIVERHRRCRKPALTVAVSTEARNRLGLGSDIVIEVGGKHLVPAGINVIDGTEIDRGELEEEVFEVNEDEVAVNVNTSQEMEIAEELLMKRSCGGTDDSDRCRGHML